MFGVIEKGLDAGGVAVGRGQDEGAVALLVLQVEVGVGVKKEQQRVLKISLSKVNHLIMQRLFSGKSEGFQKHGSQDKKRYSLGSL
jgi:hypothetical protein